MIKSIILSGLPVSGKTTLAKKLSEIHHWPVFSVGQLWRDEWRQRYPDGKISFEEFWRHTTIEENHRKNHEARKVFQKGQVIGDTRYAVYCRDLPALLIFVTANLQTRAYRAARMDEYLGLSFQEIESTLQEREEDEVRMGKKLYGEQYDYRDPRHYHMTLNTEMLTLEEEVAAIENLMLVCNMRT